MTGSFDPASLRIGQGYDVHAFAEGRKLILGGVDVPHVRGLLGHSDADVLAHAISDALLGGIRGGDIGKLFPDTDPAFKDADSLKLLAAVADKAIQRNIGARGLRAVMEGILTQVMFDIPSDPTIRQVTITADCVAGLAQPVILREAEPDEKVKTGKAAEDPAAPAS